jgi:hypothetical protein
MSQANETTRAILFYLASRGAFVWRQNTGAVVSEYNGKKRLIRYGTPGAPDVEGVLPDGRYIGVEIKVGRDKLRDVQIAFHEEVRQRGGVIAVVWPQDWQEVLEAALDTQSAAEARTTRQEAYHAES